MTAITIYHNPRCGTSRNTLALIREAGLEPTVVHYLETPPNRAQLQGLIEACGLTARALLRAKEPLHESLGLGDEGLSESQLLDAMVAHPVLINRPIVVTAQGARLCRPAELVLDLLLPRS